MLLRLITVLGMEPQAAEDIATPEVVGVGCMYTRVLWRTGAPDALHLLAKVAATEPGREALVNNDHFIQLLPLLLDVSTKGGLEGQQQQQQQQLENIGMLRPLVVQLLRLLAFSFRLQCEVYTLLRWRREVLFEVLGVVGIQPAAHFLSCSLQCMQQREKQIKNKEVETEEPHDGWLQFVVETDKQYRDACSAALEALYTIEFILQQSCGERSQGAERQATTWALRFVLGLEDLLLEAGRADDMSLRAEAAACIRLLQPHMLQR